MFDLTNTYFLSIIYRIHRRIDTELETPYYFSRLTIHRSQYFYYLESLYVYT